MCVDAITSIKMYVCIYRPIAYCLLLIVSCGQEPNLWRVLSKSDLLPTRTIPRQSSEQGASTGEQGANIITPS